MGLQPSHLVIICDPSTRAKSTYGTDPAATSTQEARKKSPGAGNYILEASCWDFTDTVWRRIVSFSLLEARQRMSESFWVTADHL